MKKIDLAPTKVNILQTMKKDVLKRNVHIKSFIEMLDFLDDNTSISLNGEWGTGKTFFIKQVINILNIHNDYLHGNEEEHEIEEAVTQAPYINIIKLSNNFVPIYYNAWDNDSHQDPILSLIYNIVKEEDIAGKEKISKSKIEKIVSVLDVLNPWSSGSLSALLEKYQDEDPLIEIRGNETIKEILKGLFDSVLVERGDKLVVFIDELDRCNPTFAVRLLERIKHFFDDDRIIFVFGINLNQLQYTISTYYGERFDSFRYLNKFFDVSVEISPIRKEDYLEYLGFVLESNYYHITAYELVKNNELTMRDCNRYVQALKIAEKFVVSYAADFMEEKGEKFSLMFYIPMLLLLKVINIQGFMQVLKGDGYLIIEKLINKSQRIKEALSNFMNKDSNDQVSDELFLAQSQDIYNVIFNNAGDSVYKSNKVLINKENKKMIMDVVTLLKIGMK